MMEAAHLVRSPRAEAWSTGCATEDARLAATQQQRNGETNTGQGNNAMSTVGQPVRHELQTETPEYELPIWSNTRNEGGRCLQGYLCFELEKLK
jgi:hypothetical protein